MNKAHLCAHQKPFHIAALLKHEPFLCRWRCAAQWPHLPYQRGRLASGFKLLPILKGSPASGISLPFRVS